MRVLVVGGGLYGCVAAVELARAGHRVTLREKQPEILFGATRANQGRIHRGFHYPRSLETAAEAELSAGVFEKRFASAVYGAATQQHWYGIATPGETTSHQYSVFLEGLSSRWSSARRPDWTANLDWTIETYEERCVDATLLRAALYRELALAHVELQFGPYRPLRDRPGQDRVVVATYGIGWPAPLQWEVVEVCLFLAPDDPMRNKGIVVLDGPFCSVDPMADGRHMVYDVEASVHHRSVGYSPDVPSNLRDLVDAGELTTLCSRWREIQARASRFVPAIGESLYEGSMFTLRAVLPGHEATDARPWQVEQIGNNINVLPGKLASCLSAAARVVELCRE